MRERKKVIWVWCSKLFTVKNARIQNLKNSYIFTKHIVQLHTHSWIHEGIKSRATENVHTNCAITINPLFFNMRTWHLPSLPHIYSSVFTYLRHICKEKICANPFFRQVDEITERLIGTNISNLNNNIEIINMEIYM